MCFSRLACPSPHCPSGCLLHIQSLPLGPSCRPTPPAVSVSLGGGQGGMGLAQPLSRAPWLVLQKLSTRSTLTGNGLPAATTSGSPGSTMLWGIGSGFPTGWPEGLGHTTWEQGLKTQLGDLGQWERQDTRRSWINSSPFLPVTDCCEVQWFQRPVCKTT